jgi:hypothetical protein
MLGLPLIILSTGGSRNDRTDDVRRNDVWFVLDQDLIDGWLGVTRFPFDLYLGS